MTLRLMTLSDPVETRETRGFPSETKFLLSRPGAHRIRDWARAHLAADSHGTGTWSDEYRITSLYFDNADLDVLQRRGSFGRAKYRVRRYGTEHLVFLERKLRTKSLLVKRRTRISLADLPLVHEKDDVPLPWVGDWFRQRLELRRLKPACQVSYQRVARVGRTDLGTFRLTLDEGLQALPASGLGFASQVGPPVLEDHVILELKFRLSMPAVFKELVEKFALSPAPLSKYRYAQAALGRAHPLTDLKSPAALAELVCA